MSKSVLFVINTLGRAGAEMALLELLDRFSGEDYEVELLVLMGQGELVSRLPGHVRLLNRHFSQESVFSAGGRLHMAGTVGKALLVRATGIRLLPYLLRNYFRMLRNGRIQMDKLLWRVLSDASPRFAREYDLAIAAVEGGAAYYVADHVKAKKKAVYIHIDYPMSGYCRELDRECYLTFDRIFPISEETKDSFLSVYPECADHTHVFHNIVNQKAIREKAELPGGFTDSYQGIRILTVARLHSQKALSLAIDALKLIREAGIEAKWYVLGEGEERKALEEKIRELSLTGFFLLPGVVENPYPYYKQADLYVHATAFEGKSIAIQEAQTLGCSIIASDIQSNRQQIRDGVDGILCPLDPVSIRDAVLRLLGDRELARRLGENAAGKETLYPKDMEKLLELL